MLADQSTLNDLANKFDGRVPVRVHFLDNSSKVFLLQPTGTIREVLTFCLDKYNITDKESNLGYCSIFESKNGSSIDGHLPLDTIVSDTIRSWKDQGCDKTAKFLFMIRLYMPSMTGIQYKEVVEYRINKLREPISHEQFLQEAETTDPNALFLQFIQAVYHVITGRYPTTAEEAIDLGAIHFLFKFNEYKPASHKVGFLGNRIVEFIPVKHLKSGTSSLEEWEQKLFDKVQLYADEALPRTNAVDENNEPVGIPYFHRNGVQISPVRWYMDKIYAMVHIFGNTFFKTTQTSGIKSLPDSVFIGINHLGISLFDKTKKFIRTFHIEEIYRWGFKPNTMFYFEVSAEENPELGTGSLEFETSEGKVISDLLTDYAMSYMKERELQEARLAKLVAGEGEGVGEE